MNMITIEHITQLRNQWKRKQTKMANMVQAMETEIDNLKKKNVHESVIKNREWQLEMIIESLNAADDMIQMLMLYCSSASIELVVMERHLMKLLNEPGKAVQFAETSSTDIVLDIVKDYKRAKGAIG